MKISTRGRYALRMMVELARTQGDGYVSLTDIATKQGISKKYLEQIIPLLSRENYLQTARGLKGGYRLSRTPAEYKVGEVLRLTEGSLAPVTCVCPDASCFCDKCDECPTYPLWKKLSRIVSDYLDSVTLEDLVESRIELDSLDDAKL